MVIKITEQIIEKYTCPHNPKTTRKLGTISGCQVEILVCKDCTDDPLLANFTKILVKRNKGDQTN